MSGLSAQALEALEIDLLLEGVRRAWGEEFGGFSRVLLQRRLQHWMRANELPSLSAAQALLLRDADALASLKRSLSVSVTEMFRDPPLFRLLREEVVPVLRTFPFVKIWVAGCATGEEAYSLAILLQEEGLGERFTIYATDVDERALEQARQGRYAVGELQAQEEAYERSGGRGRLSDHYLMQGAHAQMLPALRKAILFTSHNLFGDASFGDMQLVSCRNVLIYFSAPSAARALAVLDAALPPGSFLCLGQAESLPQSQAQTYRQLGPGVALFRKNYPES